MVVVPESSVVDGETISSENVPGDLSFLAGINRPVREKETAGIDWASRLCHYKLPVLCSSAQGFGGVMVWASVW